MGYVRQKYNLATTGKLGQKLRKPVQGGSSVMNESSGSGAADAHKGSHKVPPHRRGK